MLKSRSARVAYWSLRSAPPRRSTCCVIGMQTHSSSSCKARTRRAGRARRWISSRTPCASNTTVRTLKKGASYAREDSNRWPGYCGMADPEAGQAAGIDTRFNIGSVSKVIAALAAMILCDRARLALDEPIVTWLDDLRMLSPGYERITLRHLLSHASGLPGTNFRNVFSFAPIPGYAQDTLEGLKHYHLKHEPGELAVYCNDGFTLVECLVQAVTGLPYEAFVQQEILAPLGMEHSAFALQPFPAGSVVIPYREGRRTGQEFVNAYATGGLCTTPTDMMKLAALFLNGGEHEGRRIVSSRAVLEMGTDQTGSLPLKPNPDWSWGLGWDHTRQPGLSPVGIKAWAKNGGTAFFATEFFVLPDQHMALLLTGAGHGYQPRAI